MLFKRLKTNEISREYATSLLCAAYKLKLARKATNYSMAREANMQRLYRKHKRTFMTIAKQIRNITDVGQVVENVKNAVEVLVDDVDVIKMSQYFMYEDLNQRKKANYRAKLSKNGNQES